VTQDEELAFCFWELEIEANEEMRTNKAKIVKKLIDMKANIMGNTKHKANSSLFSQITSLFA
jgi:hypothetical protein